MQTPNIGRLLASNASLQPIVAKARDIRALSKLCFDFLPPGLARLVRAVSLYDRPGDRQLVLLAASPAAAAKLKLLSEALCKFLSMHGGQVNSVSVRVQPDSRPITIVGHRRARRLSRAALAALEALHHRLPDSPARDALKILLDHQFTEVRGDRGKT